jgi:hypothetical protein
VDAKGKEFAMERTMQLMSAGPFRRPAHPATAALLAASAALVHLAARLEQRRQRMRHEPVREVNTQRVGGRAGAAVFEDGKLVAWLPDVERL